MIVRKKYYLIDHKLLFLFGYLFYFITPYVVGAADFFDGYPGIALYQSFFKKIPETKLQSYALITISWLPAFFLGHLCFKFLKPNKKKLDLFPETPLSHSTSYFAIVLLFVLVLFAFLNRNSLFGGYSSYDVNARGKMSTLLIVFNFFFIYQLISKQKISFLLIAGTIITAFLLLTQGGRMYVFQTILIWLIYKTSFSSKRFKPLQIIGVAMGCFIIGGFVGLWRMGFSIDMEKLAYSFFAEPVFTWFSTSTYLISNDIPLFNVPLNFLTSFFNLVPNTIFSLQPYVVSTGSMVQGYESPLGADSVWSNFVINFGSIGSFFFVFITGFMLNFLRHLSEHSRFAAVYYIMVCGILPFQFFRDGFFIINKQLFFNFLLLPGIILLALKTILYLQKTMVSIDAIPVESKDELA
jgi:hypothetical protein